MSSHTTAGRAWRALLSVLLAAGVAAGCSGALPSADASAVNRPTGPVAQTPSPVLSPTATPSGTPTPSPPLPASLAGRWTGVVVDPDDPTRNRVTLTLGACEPNGACGSLELRQANGTGCTYEADRAEPTAVELVYALVNGGSIDCEDAWSSAELHIRPASTGGLAVTRVFEDHVDRSFMLDPAPPAPSPSPGPSAVADPTTVVRGHTLTVTVTGFGARSDVWISLERSSVLLGHATADDAGAASVVVRIASDTPVGHVPLLVEGFDRDLRGFGLRIRIVVVR